MRKNICISQGYNNDKDESQEVIEYVDQNCAQYELVATSLRTKASNKAVRQNITKVRTMSNSSKTEDGLNKTGHTEVITICPEKVVMDTER